MKIEINAQEYPKIESRIKQLDGPAGHAIRNRSAEKTRKTYDPFTGQSGEEKYFEVELRDDLTPMQYMIIGKIIM